jgi:hypothetical protein
VYLVVAFLITCLIILGALIMSDDVSGVVAVVAILIGALWPVIVLLLLSTLASLSFDYIRSRFFSRFSMRGD